MDPRPANFTLPSEPVILQELAATRATFAGHSTKTLEATELPALALNAGLFATTIYTPN